jgi:hypothetical protein
MSAVRRRHAGEAEATRNMRWVSAPTVKRKVDTRPNAYDDRETDS